MDNLTHSLVGALIGQAGLKRRTGLAMPALIIGANLPDIDASCVVFGVESLAMRRGITHGPIAWAVLPLVLAGLLWWYDRWQARRGSRPEGRAEVRFGWLYALAFIACLTHPALDWLNNYGIRLLEPFSSRWFYGDTLFIIDVWLWIGLGFATWLSLRREKQGGGNWRNLARAALAAAVAYIAVNTQITREAERFALLGNSYSVTIASPVPFKFWKRDLIFVNPHGRHAIIRGYSGAREQPVETVYLDGVWLPGCDLERLAASDASLAAFLFWSRAPYISKSSTGEGLVLRDARFAGFGGDRFSVVMPASACGRPQFSKPMQ
jgi:inner membrane protein